MIQHNTTRTINHSRLAAPAVLFICAVFTMFMFCPRTASAAEPVTGRYLKISGDTIRLQLTIRTPSPPSLILEQYLPPGTQVLSTSPMARQVNSRSGVVKWLFKGVSTGKITVTMQVSPAAAATRVTGTIRYRLPGGGGMTERRISP